MAKRFAAVYIEGGAGVSNDQLSEVPTATFKGRATAGTGDSEDLTVAQATALLDVATSGANNPGLKGLVPPPTLADIAKFLKGDLTWATLSLSPAIGGAGGIVARRTVTGPASVTLAITDHLILVNTSGGAVTLTLPNPSTTDRIYEIKDIAGTFGTNACTLARFAGGDQIEGLAANYLLEANWQSLRIGSDGSTKWWLL